MCRTVLVGDGLEKDQDFFTSVHGGLSLKLNLPANFGLDLGFYGNRRVNERRHDEDVSVFSSWIGGNYKWQDNKLSLTVRQQTLWLSDEHYQDQYLALGKWAHSFHKSNLLTLYAHGKISRYRNAKHLDSDGYQFGAVFYQQFYIPLSPLLSVEVYGGEDKLKKPDYDYLGYSYVGARLASRFALTDNDILLIYADFRNRHYKEANPFFLDIRDDRRYGITGRYSHYFFDKRLALSLQGSWLLNESSIELYDYQRNFVTLSLKWKF